MAECSVCGADETLPFRCSYCGLVFCSAHRLPEKHGCVGVVKAKSPEEIRMRAAVRYSPRAPKTQLVFGRNEILHLAAATAAVCLAGLGLIGFRFSPTASFAVLVAGFAASFIGHELAHKFVGTLRGLAAEFRLFPTGLFVTLLTAVLPVPFKVIMPGGVVIRGLASIKTVGEIAVAGPLFNLVAAAALFVLGKLLAYPVFETIASINAFLMFFNLLPIPPLDGEKVLAWGWKVWAVVFAVSLLLMTAIQLI
ncbi:MAG: hypothetical protein NZ956_03750 [Candidatus Caldarchaeum sp.]|nr:hypothetical protein [Candidatus Caldarchaeum sp.]